MTPSNDYTTKQYDPADRLARTVERDVEYLERHFGGDRERQISIVQGWLRYHQDRGRATDAAAAEAILARWTEEYIVNP